MAYQVDWPADNPRKTKTEIEMVECSEFFDDSKDKTEGYIGNPVFNPYVTHSARRSNIKEESWVCPNTTSLNIKGNFGTAQFSYIELSLKECDLPGDQCYTGAELDDKISR